MAQESFPSLGAPAWPGKLTRTGLWMIGIGLVLAAVSGPSTRFGIVGFGPGLLTLGVGLLLTIIGLLLGLVGFLFSTMKGTPIPRGIASVLIVAGLALTGYLLTWVRVGTGVPPIHEISTDLDAPPPFVAVKEIRDRIPNLNSSDYVREVQGRSGVINVPEAQRKAYPQVQPLVLPLPPDQVFARAEAAAREMGWEIVASVPSEGRLEATDTTRFFGFRDDVVVRLRSEGGSTRIDVRSKSRVGLGDAGTNAKRVVAFLDRVRAGG